MTLPRVIRRPALALLFVSLSGLAIPVAAQQKTLTLDDLLDPQKRVDFSGTVPVITWLDDTTYLWAKGDRTAPPELLRVNALTGATTPFHDPARLERALTSLAGITPDEAKRLARPRTLPMNKARTQAVMTVGGDLYLYDIAGAKVARLTSDPAPEDDPTFSPDGRLLAFTRTGNLFVVEAATGRERQLTTDGSAELLNGKLDWVYQEEVYGRGTYRAFWWSPDSSKLAFLQLDQKPVPEITLVDHIPHRQEVEVFDYPKAGDPNPTVKLGVVRAAGGTVQWVDTTKYSAQEHLIVNVSWTPDSKHVVYSLQDREQTWLDLNFADASSGAARTLFRETTKAWVDRLEDPVWLKDGTFIWTSERTGWQHYYHYKADGTLIKPITEGKWEARSFYGVDEAAGWLYFAGTERSHLGSDVYRVKMDGSGFTRLSGQAAGSYSANFNPSFTYYVGTWSDASTPTQTRLHKADGTEVRVIEANKVAALDTYRRSKPEFLQVKTRDGFVMEAMIIKPPDFDPSRQYPVLQQTYAGPHAPQVRNAWSGGSMYNQLLAQNGIIVWVCDNRSASGKGAESAWEAYQRLGETELADIEDGLAWLKQQPWVDGSRIGISGWSYGGFMTSYALTHSTSFAMGIAGGSVTDWTLYDSIYTERFMRMPQNNPEGYKRTSVIGAAKDLSGKLLLVHGTMDDNVHMQNTIRLAYELQKAGKPFELMVYPKSRHGVSDPQLRRHMQTTMFEFTKRTLLGTEGAARTEATR